MPNPAIKEAIKEKISAWARMKLYIDELLKRIPDFTGQINVEVHLKDGIVKDVYFGNRSKNF